MKKTVLHDAHIKLGAKMVEFAGYDMPIQYTTITDEHEAVRTEAGLFDVSHMGEIYVVGSEATEFVDYVFTNNVVNMKNQSINYGFLCYPDGGVVDDLLVYKISDTVYLLVVNASNIEKDFNWLNQNNTFDVEIINKSDEISEIALQGPKAETFLQYFTQTPLETIGFFTFAEIDLQSRPFLVSRTGYTGEDGFEIYGDHRDIYMLWHALLEHHPTLKPIGLGARDTLRFEVALPLYGNELSPEITPVEAGLTFAIDKTKKHFIGASVLHEQLMNKPSRKIVGLDLLSKGILRHGYQVLHEDTVVGHVTTGYYGPSVQSSIAMALIDKPHGKIGNQLHVMVRNKRLPVAVRNKKFYDKNTKGK